MSTPLSTQPISDRLTLVFTNEFDYLQEAINRQKDAQKAIRRHTEEILQTILRPILEEAVRLHNERRPYKLTHTEFSLVEGEPFELRIKTQLRFNNRKPDENFGEDVDTYFEIFTETLKERFQHHSIPFKVGRVELPIKYFSV